MRKEKSFRGIKFTPRLVRRGIDKARAVFGSAETKYRGHTKTGDESSAFDTLEEFWELIMTR